MDLKSVLFSKRTLNVILYYIRLETTRRFCGPEERTIFNENIECHPVLITFGNAKTQFSKIMTFTRFLDRKTVIFDAMLYILAIC